MENKEPKVLLLGSPMAVELYKMGYPGQNNSEYHGYKLQTRKTDYYDAVIDYHSLQIIPNRDTVSYLEKIGRTMKVDGVLNLFVPSLEWAADQIVFAEMPSPILLIHLFGNQQGPNQEHRSGHTLRGLRRDMTLAGFAVTHASEGYYSMSIKGQDGMPVEIEAGQNIIVATKKERGANEVYKTVGE